MMSPVVPMVSIFRGCTSHEPWYADQVIAMTEVNGEFRFLSRRADGCYAGWDDECDNYEATLTLDDWLAREEWREWREDQQARLRGK